ncbi:hypothetical protein Bhyg_06108 [Pseudolycoriella hygida]|uniref:Secreted protein n=1 Tax=Pseudolycoriella hygida TaxID=35572 RepID=A0A9Q0S241_9DIPT|nr:hypothetical protein Bhyg_06108 [Pseudolycoriella hygida]
MNKIVVFLMLCSYCAARSIDEALDTLDTQKQPPLKRSIDEENPTQIAPDHSHE